MTVTMTDDRRWRVDLRPTYKAAVHFSSKTMAEAFLDLIDGGVPPATALERVAGRRESAASAADEQVVD